MSGAVVVFVAAVVVAALLCLYLVRWRRRKHTTRLIGELLEGYFDGRTSVEQVGQRAREISSHRFLGGPEVFALTHAAFQRAADATLAQSYSLEAEQRLLSLFAALKNEFGQTERYLARRTRVRRSPTRRCRRPRIYARHPPPPFASVAPTLATLFSG
jgi:hypothetical protein